MFILKEARHYYLYCRDIILLGMDEIVWLFIREALKLYFVKLFSFRGVMAIAKLSFSFLRFFFFSWDTVFCHTIIIIDFLIVFLIFSWQNRAANLIGIILARLSVCLQSLQAVSFFPWRPRTNNWNSKACHPLPSFPPTQLHHAMALSGVLNCFFVFFKFK